MFVFPWLRVGLHYTCVNIAQSSCWFALISCRLTLVFVAHNSVRFTLIYVAFAPLYTEVAPLELKLPVLGVRWGALRCAFSQFRRDRQLHIDICWGRCTME